MSGDWPCVAEVRLSRWGACWVVTSNDQREWYLKTSKYPDELAAFMVVTDMLKKEQERATRTQTEEGQD
jgi:hypothetical protein